MQGNHLHLLLIIRCVGARFSSMAMWTAPNALFNTAAFASHTTILLPSSFMTICHGGRTRDTVFVAIVAGGWPQRPRVACGAASAVFCSCEQVMKRVDSCEAGRYTWPVSKRVNSFRNQSAAAKWAVTYITNKCVVRALRKHYGNNQQWLQSWTAAHTSQALFPVLCSFFCSLLLPLPFSSYPKPFLLYCVSTGIRCAIHDAYSS